MSKRSKRRKVQAEIDALVKAGKDPVLVNHKKRTAHGKHALLAVATFGLSTPMWAAAAVKNAGATETDVYDGGPR